MKRVFSVPQSNSEPPAQESQLENPHKSLPASTPPPAVYVRQITEQHQNTITRILAKIRNQPREKEEEKREE